MNVVIIGGGAAGFFCAINTALQLPGAKIIIFEKSNKVLSKVRVSGGGRCNVTHALFDVKELVKKYPRGEKELLSAFSKFSTASTIEWFKQRNVFLKVEPDGRMFPVTDSSETIIDCFLNEANKLGIRLMMNTEVMNIEVLNKEFILTTNGEQYHADAIVVASGGNSDESFQKIIMKLGHSFVPSVPSLFTFNVPKHPINSLMGVSVANAGIKIMNTKFQEEGPLLITHWGFSGPAILRLSAWGARYLAQCKYHFKFFINWLNPMKADAVYLELLSYKQQYRNKNMLNFDLELPKRLWKYLLSKNEISEHLLWQNISKSQLQNLSRLLCNDEYEAHGKTTFKEEFVTCGGVNLKEIDFKTMESKLVPGLYFAGEIIDVDGITGGFNFQNAWTTAWIAANTISIS